MGKKSLLSAACFSLGFVALAFCTDGSPSFDRHSFGEQRNCGARRQRHRTSARCSGSGISDRGCYERRYKQRAHEHPVY